MSDTKEFTVADLFRKRQSGEIPFEAHTYYDQEADCVTYFHEDVSTNSSQLDPFITLYYEPSSCRLVGYKVKCVRTLVQKLIEKGLTPDSIRFRDVLELAGEMSENHRKKADRDQARGSELADVLLPRVD